MPVHDFLCKCGAKEESRYFPIDEVPRSLMCETCGEEMYQTWGKGFNKKRSLTDILGPNADHHPQMGTDVKIESPDHYRQLLKEYDMEEAGDPQKGSRNWMQDKVEKERTRPEREKAAPATEQQIAQAKL